MNLDSKNDLIQKKYFPPLYPMPYVEEQYKNILKATNAIMGENPTWDEYLEKSQKTILKVESDEQYGDPGNEPASEFIKKMIRNVMRMGILKKSNGNISAWSTGKEYLKGDMSFSDFLWYSIKRGWVLQHNLPEGIEALKRVLRIVKNSDEPLRHNDIKERLKSIYRFNENRNDLQEFIRLLKFMAGLKLINDSPKKYTLGKNHSTLERRFSNCDIFSKLENILRRNGPNTNLLSDKTKRDLAKYYMYRESGGWGKQSRWYKTFWKEYLDVKRIERTIDNSKPKLYKAEKFLREKDKRDLREKICNKFNSIEVIDIKNLSKDILEKIAQADNPREAHKILTSAKTKMSRIDLEKMKGGGEPYSFPSKFELWKWQKEAVTEWFEGVSNKDHQPETGIVEVVTGAGKTIMALEVVRRWLKKNPEGKVSVIVPTKVLMYQWLKEFAEKLHVPADEIGWLGDGNKDNFSDGYNIIVSIVNSAVKNDFLKKDLEKFNEVPHLLIADECHRYTGEVFRKVFDCPRTASLGLSATPVDPQFKENTEKRGKKDQILLDELGSIFYELSYKEARKMEIIPPFEIHYIGIDLSTTERAKYDKLTKKIRKVLKKIKAKYDNWLWKLDGKFEQKLNHILNEIEGHDATIGKYFTYVQKRREIVDEAIARQGVCYKLLKENFMFKLDLDMYQECLREGPVDEKLRGAFQKHDHKLPEDIVLSEDENRWSLKKDREKIFWIENTGDSLNVYKKTIEDRKRIVFQERIKQLEELITPFIGRQKGVNPRTGELSEETIPRRALYEEHPGLKEIDKKIEDLFSKANYKPVMYHTGHEKEIWNRFAIEWFSEEGFANVMLSVKALIEGVDVPNADIGIIRVSTSSLRQRIQTLGRILRNPEDVDKEARLYVIYARDTVDERLFKEVDWGKQLGNAEIVHEIWEPSENDPAEGYLRVASEDEKPDTKRFEEKKVREIDVSELEVEDEYPGRYEGYKISIDADGNPFEKTNKGRKYIVDKDIKRVGNTVKRLKGGGRIAINEKGHILTLKENKVIYLGKTDPNLDFNYEEKKNTINSIDDDITFEEVFEYD